MPLVADGYKTKKELRAAVGGRLKSKETSIFGPEYPQDGTGKVTIAGPTADTCTWDAEVTLKDHVIMRVE